jgi:hypothetical protein
MLVEVAVLVFMLLVAQEVLVEQEVVDLHITEQLLDKVGYLILVAEAELAVIQIRQVDQVVLVS